MQTNDQQEPRHEHGIRQQLLYAGVTLAALSTGLLVSARPAQAATVAEGSSLVTQKKANSQNDQQERDQSNQEQKQSEQPNHEDSNSGDNQPDSQAEPKKGENSEKIPEQNGTEPTNQPVQPASHAGQPAAPGTTVTPKKQTLTQSSQAVKTVDESKRVSLAAGSAKFSRSRSMSRMMAIPATVDVTISDDTTNDATTDDGFTYALNATGDGYTITGYTGSATDIAIPDAHLNDAGKSINVSAIADGVFKGHHLTSLVMGANIATIGQASFENNLLKTIDFSKNKGALWGISANAFADNKLTGTLALPASITQIGDNAFAGSDKLDGSGNQLTGVDFGNNLKTVQIGNGAFAYNRLASLVLPVGTITIGNMAFTNNQLTSVSLGTQLTTIGSSAFNSNQLTTVALPDLVATIGESAFSANHTLKQITLGKQVQTIGDAAFAGDSIDGNLYIPNAVTTIGNTAFAGNHLTGLRLGDENSKLQTIGSAAFSGNTTLTGKLVIPDSVTFINDGAFAGDALTAIDFGKSAGTIGNDAFIDNHLTGTLTLSDGIQHVNDDAFAGNQLTGLKLGTGLVTIGNNTFAGNQVTGTLDVPDLVTTIGENAFGSNRLKTLTLGKSVKTIGATAFASNQLQGTLVVPGSVTDVGALAFASNQLRGIQLEGPVNSMGNGAFSDNDLQQIQAAQPITHLGDNALAGQKTLTVTVNQSGNQLTGIRAAITKQLQLQNFSLTDPMVFKLNGTQVMYDPATDALTLPAGFSGNSLVLSLTSGTTGDATDHSGNYGVAALTLRWSTPSHGSGTTGSTTPTIPTKPTTPTEPAKPATPTVPGQSTNPAKPTRPQKKSSSHQAKQPQSKGMTVKRTGRRVVFKLADPAIANDTRQGMPVSTWSYTHQSVIVKRGTSVDGQATQEQTQLPQTYERPNYWSVIGATLLTVLAGLGLGERRRR